MLGQTSQSTDRSTRDGSEIVPASAVAELTAMPGFSGTTRDIAWWLIDDYLADRYINRVFNDRGRYLAGLLALYLHRVPLEGEADAGLTVGRMKTLCTRAGISSPGRAVAILSIMRFGGYLKQVPSAQDRRKVILVPTERFVALQRRRWHHLFSAMANVIPEARQALDLYTRPEFEAAFLDAAFKAFAGGFRFVHHAPVLTPYFEHTSGFQILLQLQMKSGGGGSVPLTISELASQFWLSRAHVRSVLTLATADGFIQRTAGSRDPIVVLPALSQATDRFFASAFLLARHCIRHAIAATAP
jgi:hypothetical protein